MAHEGEGSAHFVKHAWGKNVVVGGGVLSKLSTLDKVEFELGFEFKSELKVKEVGDEMQGPQDGALGDTRSGRSRRGCEGAELNELRSCQF